MNKYVEYIDIHVGQAIVFAIWNTYMRTVNIVFSTSSIVRRRTQAQPTASRDVIDRLCAMSYTDDDDDNDNVDD